MLYPQWYSQALTAWLFWPTFLACCAGTIGCGWSARAILNRLLATTCGAIVSFGVALLALEYGIGTDRDSDVRFVIIATPPITSVLGYCVSRWLTRRMAASTQEPVGK
jgi:hypothetical protein